MNQSIIWQGKHLLTSKIPCSIAGQLPATKMPGLQGARRSDLRCLACFCCTPWLLAASAHTSHKRANAASACMPSQKGMHGWWSLQLLQLRAATL